MANRAGGTRTLSRNGEHSHSSRSIASIDSIQSRIHVRQPVANSVCATYPISSISPYPGRFNLHSFSQ